MKNIVKNKNGITLIALVITVIVLLILAGISISMLTGKNSIINESREARDETVAAQEKEILEIAVAHVMAKSTNSSIDTSSLSTELGTYAGQNKTNITTSGNNLIVEFKTSKNKYKVKSNGEVSAVVEFSGDPIDRLKAYFVGKNNYRELLDENSGIYKDDDIIEDASTTIKCISVSSIKYQYSETEYIYAKLTYKNDDTNDVVTNVDEISEDTLSIKIRVNSGEDGVVGLPVTNFYAYSYIDWGDGTIESDVANLTKKQHKLASLNNIQVATIVDGPSVSMLHTYTEINKEFVVTILGGIDRISSNLNGCTKEKILEIVQWGETGLKYIDLGDCTNLRKIAEPSEDSFRYISNFNDSFAGCTGLTGNVPELWNLNNGTMTGDGCFYGCTQVTNYSSIPDSWKAMPL